MKRLWLPLLTALFIFWTAGWAQTQPATDGFIGRFVVTDIVGYDNVSGGIPEAKRLLGKTLVISSDAIEFDHDRCRPAKGFRIIEVEASHALMKEYAVNAGDVGLSGKTLLLDSDDCAPVFKMDSRRIIFGWNGVIVRAIRDDAK